MADVIHIVDDDLETQTTQRLLYGLRIAVAAITATIMLTASLWRKLDAHDPVQTQLLAFGVLATILAVEGVLIVLHRSWSRRLRWAAVVAALAASALSTWTLQAEHLTTATDWAFGTAAWFGVVLLLDRPLWWLVGFLALHEAFTVARVLAAGLTSEDVLLNLVAGSLGTIGYPLGAGIGAGLLRGVSRSAARALRETERIRTAEELSTRLHEHRQERFADLYRTTEPLLQGLADGYLDPADPRVQRTCAIEAARMRRLFAETDAVADPLLHELRHCADVADRRGVVVEFEARGSWTSPPLDVRRALTEAPVAVLSTAESSARVSVMGTPDLLSVSVVADSAPCEVPSPGDAGVQVNVIEDGPIVWVEAQWPTKP